MFQGLRTVIYAVSDLQKAKDWYAQVLSKEPYFSEPFYVGFNVGGYELGLDPDMKGVAPGNNAVAYWGVADARAAHARLVSLGAREHRPIQDVGGGNPRRQRDRPLWQRPGRDPEPALQAGLRPDRTELQAGRPSVAAARARGRLRPSTGAITRSSPISVSNWCG